MIRIALILGGLALIAAVQQGKPPKPTETPKATPTPSVTATPETTPPASPAATPPPAPEAPADTHTVAKETLTLTFDADGSFEAIDPFEAKIKFEAFQGELTIVSLAANGAAVKKGDEVLRLDAPQLKQMIEATTVDVGTAQALVAKSEKDQVTGSKIDSLLLSIQHHTLATAEATLKWWSEQDGKQMLEGAALYVKRVQDAIDDQADELNQLKKMYQSEELTNATSEIVIKRAERYLAQLQVYMKWAKEDVKKVGDFQHPEMGHQLQSVIDQGKLQIEQLEYMTVFNKTNREAELTRAKAGLQQQQITLGKLKKDWEQLNQKSTVDGVVLYGGLQQGAWMGHDPKVLKIGEKAGPGQVLLTVYTPGRLKVKTDLPESQRFWLKAGTKVLVTPAATPEAPIDAKVSEISFITAMKGPAPAFELTIDVGTADARFVPGMKVSIHADLGEVKDALLVPVTALQHNKVFIRGKDKDGKDKDEPRVVVTGRTDGKNVEIVKGLNVGDAVVTQPK